MNKGCRVSVALLTDWVKFWKELGKPTPALMYSVKYFELTQIMSDTYGGFICDSLTKVILPFGHMALMSVSLNGKLVPSKIIIVNLN